jgi:hypothetical protein
MPFCCSRAILPGSLSAKKGKFAFDANVLLILVRYITICVLIPRCAANETLFARGQLGEETRCTAD